MYGRTLATRTVTRSPPPAEPLALDLPLHEVVPDEVCAADVEGA